MTDSTVFSRRLHQVYRRLRDHFGYAERWWPGSPLEVTLTAILVQQCDWSDAWAGVGRLREQGLLSLPRLAAANPDDIAACIRGVSFVPTKSRRLVGFAHALVRRGFEQIEGFLAIAHRPAQLRNDLLSLDGIGEETADCILLFAAEYPSFVVDTYTRRAFQRIGLFPELGDAFWSRPYGELKDFFERHILAAMPLYADCEFAAGVPCEVALLRDYHAQLVELGKHHCLKTNPRCRSPGKPGWKNYEFCKSHCPLAGCAGCSLAAICQWAQNHDGPREAIS